MDLSLALNELSAQHQLTSEANARLRALSGLDDEPPSLTRAVVAGIAILAAALGGLGIIFWIAANWDSLGRSGQFALLQCVVFFMCAGAFALPCARVPLGLLALLATGGLFAYFGQTYQTGADPWQLFAVWAVRSLPLCLGIRHDVLWAPWALIALSAVSLWVHAIIGSFWRFEQSDLNYYLIAWVGALAIAAFLSPLCKRYTGAGPWSLRTSITLAAIVVMITALGALDDLSIHYWLALALLAGAAFAFSRPPLFDIFAMSVIGLVLNVLLVCLLARLVLRNGDGESIPGLLLVGLSAAGMLAGTVHLILQASRKEARHD